MQTCQDYLSEIRDKLHQVEDQLTAERVKLYKADEIYTEEREKWAKEIKEEQLKVHANEKEIKKKEERLSELKSNYEEVLRSAQELESEQKVLKKEIQKLRIAHQDETNKFLLEQRNLEVELKKIQTRLDDLKSTNKWTKHFQDKELLALESENESKLKEEVKLISDDLARKIETFDENLKEVNKASLEPRRQRLKELEENLAAIVSECEKMEAKNKILERDIELLE